MFNFYREAAWNVKCLSGGVDKKTPSWTWEGAFRKGLGMSSVNHPVLDLDAVQARGCNRAPHASH